MSGRRAEAAAQEIVQHLGMLSVYWAGDHIPDPSVEWRVGGVAFSFLSMLDGSASPPAVVLAPAAQDLPAGYLPGGWAARWPAVDPLGGQNAAVAAFDAREAARGEVPLPALPGMHQAGGHLFQELRALERFFTQPQGWTMQERTSGLAYALLKLLDGEVRGAHGWVLYPAEDAEDLPAVHLGEMELHGTWSAARWPEEGAPGQDTPPN